ncbi:hypothetical protein CU097_008897 [Rhizopus azygosporus]|uniref:Uncharacterized protein n=1 Tax=Rhizopus azygosporus TaxID=86630 RepID=A0A367J307_RHIAZ|nr:hypothetical protein CU097_008897 [Rhizopus azygosporus]
MLNNDAIKKTNGITSPSDIFKSRKKGLPRLGGVRTYTRCNESILFLDTHTGPMQFDGTRNVYDVLD